MNNHADEPRQILYGLNVKCSIHGSDHPNRHCPDIRAAEEAGTACPWCGKLPSEKCDCVWATRPAQVSEVAKLTDEEIENSNLAHDWYEGSWLQMTEGSRFIADAATAKACAWKDGQHARVREAAEKAGNHLMHISHRSILSQQERLDGHNLAAALQDALAEAE